MLGHIIDTLEDLSSLLRRKQAQAMLDLFEADCGRAAVTLNEIPTRPSRSQKTLTDNFSQHLEIADVIARRLDHCVSFGNAATQEGHVDLEGRAV